MSQLVIKHPGNTRTRNRRLGLILLLAALLYIGAVIVFVIIY